MRPETAEWIEMAEADFRTATREVAAEEFPNYDAVCFHAQQSAEKYLKALLVEHGIYFPKTHHLPSLADLLQPVRPEMDTCRAELARLTPYAIDVRYPGGRAVADAARESPDRLRQGTFAASQIARCAALSLIERAAHPNRRLACGGSFCATDIPQRQKSGDFAPPF